MPKSGRKRAVLSSNSCSPVAKIAAVSSSENMEKIRKRNSIKNGLSVNGSFCGCGNEQEIVKLLRKVVIILTTLRVFYGSERNEISWWLRRIANWVLGLFHLNIKVRVRSRKVFILSGILFITPLALTKFSELPKTLRQRKLQITSLINLWV